MESSKPKCKLLQNLSSSTTSNSAKDIIKNLNVKFDNETNNCIECEDIPDLIPVIESEYIIEEDVVKFFEHVGVNELKFVHINCRSIPSNYSDIVNFITLSDTQYSAIAVTETWLKEYNENLYQIDGYTFISLVRSNCRIGGGVGIYINNNINFEVRADLNRSNELIECIFIEITVNNSKVNKTKTDKVIFGSIYRPPGGDILSFCNEINSILCILDKKNYKLSVFSGDFNIDIIKSTSHQPTNDFVNQFLEYGYLSVINKPTRVTNVTATLIDNFFIKTKDLHAKGGIVYNDISDHFPIILRVDLSMPNEVCYISKNIRQYNEKSVQKCLECLSEIDWSFCCYERYKDVDIMYDIFSSVYGEIYNKCFPIVTTKISRKKCPRKKWITTGLIKSCLTKSKLYRLFKLKPTVENEVNYKTYRNKLKSLLKIAEKNYYTSRIALCCGNIKDTWKVLQEAMNKSSGNKFINWEFNIEGEQVRNPKTIVDNFNNFFVSIGNNLASKINRSENDFSTYLDGSYLNSFALLPTDASEIIGCSSRLASKKSSGFDGVTVDIMKRSINIVAEPLSNILNASFLTGKIPRALKIAKVCPIHKDGSLNEINNYRPVSVLPSFSKIFEKVVYNRLIVYVNKLNILSNSQYGFRENHSTSMALIDFYDKVSKSIDERKFTIGIFIDLKKAFDTIDHKILLSKLNHYGVRGIALKWFENYLSERQQYVCLNDINSPYRPISCGLPQGSILSPLLFIIYVNDIVNCSKIIHFILFADDTNLFFSGNDIHSLIVEINNNLKLLSTWFKANKLSLNLKKTNFIMFGNKVCDMINNALTIEFDGSPIEQVFYTKFLGVFIDSKFLWNIHISKMSSTISRSIGIMRNLYCKLPTTSLFNLYNTLILPYLTYCNIVWGCAAKTNLEVLLKLQKKAIRIVTKSKYLASTDQLFHKLNILKIIDIYRMQVAIFVYLVYNYGKTCHVEISEASLFYNRFHFKLYNKPYAIRNVNDSLLVPYSRTNVRGHSICCAGPIIWNALPLHVRNSLSMKCFKSSIKSYLISHYCT